MTKNFVIHAFFFKKKGILISYHSLSIVRPSVHAFISLSVTFLVIVYFELWMIQLDKKLGICVGVSTEV